MIPILFDKNETAFTGTGIARLVDTISCVVTEERNGIYECDFEYSTDGANYELIQVGRIIGVTHDETGQIQPFDIVSYTKPIDKVVTFHCVHISYRMSYMSVRSTVARNSLADVFSHITTYAQPTCLFTFWTDKTSTGYCAALGRVPHTVRQILGGIEGSILDTYGGEYEWDMWQVKLWASRGQFRDFTIRYGVNMLDYNEELDSSGCYSACRPYWTDGKNTVVGDKQVYGGITPSGREQCIPLDVSDKFESQPTQAQVEAQAVAIMNAQTPTIPAQTIEVSFVRLQDMGEFADYQNLLQCRLCDTINVIFPDFNSSGTFKIVKTVWNVLTSKYESMELGQLSVSLSEALGISNTLEKMSDYLTLDSNGDLIIPGGIYLNSHTAPVGNFDSYNSSKSIPSGNSPVALSGKITVSPGSYILVGEASFPSSATGVRHLEWRYGSTPTAIDFSRITVGAVSGGFPTRVQSVLPISVNASEDYYMYCYQNSGSAQTVSYYWRLIRIA